MRGASVAGPWPAPRGGDGGLAIGAVQGASVAEPRGAGSDKRCSVTLRPSNASYRLDNAADLPPQRAGGSPTPAKCAMNPPSRLKGTLQTTGPRARVDVDQDVGSAYGGAPHVARRKQGDRPAIFGGS